MIYFLVNNNYNYIMVERMLEDLQNYSLALIQVPYELKILNKDDRFSDIYLFKNHSGMSITSPIKILNMMSEIDRCLAPNENDILLATCDFDLVNQYIIQIFFSVNSRIYLLEDGGAWNLTGESPPFRSKIRELVLRYVFGFKYMRIKKFGEQIYPIMDDSLFSGIISDFWVVTKREIKLFAIENKMDKVIVSDKKGAIFLNEPIYLYYSSEEGYIDFLIQIIAQCEVFAPFHFKFHPSDSESFKKVIKTRILDDFPFVSLCNDENPIESIIESFPVKYVISILSVGLHNLMLRGLVPIYLNKIFNKQFHNISFDAVEVNLKEIGCESPSTIQEIRPGFNPFKKKQDDLKSRESIRKILRL